MTTRTVKTPPTEEELSHYWAASKYLGKQKFYKYLKEQPALSQRKVTQANVDAFLSKMESMQIKAKPKREALQRTIVASGPRSDYQIDIMVYTRNPRNGFSYVLGCIDVYSRFAMCVPLKTREQKASDSAVMKGVRQIFEKMGKPQNINCDNEFTSRAFLELCEKEGIKLWLSNADEAVIDSKNSIIERFWKTLAQRIADYRSNTGEGNWPIYLDEIVSAYNNTYHDTIRGVPALIFAGKETNKQDIVIIPTTYQVGDTVRIRLQKTNFAKGDEEVFSRDIYVLTKKDPVKRNRWFLRNTSTGADLERSYMERDFSSAREAVKPNVVVVNRLQEDAKEKKQNLTKRKIDKEIKELEISAQPSLYTPAAPKRAKKPTKKLDI